MANLPSGISSNDLQTMLNDFGQTVSWEDSTLATSNITGDRTPSYSAAVDKTVIILPRTKRYVFDKAGITEVGDGYIISKHSEGFARNDRITYDGKIYIIRTIFNRFDLYDYCILDRVDES